MRKINIRKLASRQALTSYATFLKKEKQFTVGLVIVLGLILIAILAPLLTPYSPEQLGAGPVLQGPSLAHPFGTDNYGRDEFARVIYAARPDLTVSIAAVAISALTGVPVGILSGYRGRRSDMVIMAFIDIMLAFPIIVFAMAMVVALGIGATACTIAVGIAGMPLFARISRGDTLVVRETQYVEAAYAAGSRDRRIMQKHILPNITSGVIVFATLDIGNVLLLVAGLSFIGLGISPPTAEWGLMIFDGTSFILRGEWWLMWFPGLVLLLAVLAFNFMGDGLRDILDPTRMSQ